MLDHGECPVADGIRDLAWRKSRRSNPNGACVEFAPFPDGRVGVRHSRRPEGTVLVLTPAEFAAFLDAVKVGEFDDLLPTADHDPAR